MQSESTRRRATPHPLSVIRRHPLKGALYTAEVETGQAMRDRPLRNRVPDAVADVLAALRTRGHAAYLVGGCVRDLARGEDVRDFDIATSAPARAVLDLLPRAIPIGIRHGTVMVPTASGPVDVTTFRAGPRIEDDLGCRDFTINAMAYDPESHALLDPFGGRDDLARLRLRAVGDAEARFREDPLRVLRAARLVATLGVTPEPALETAMAKLASELQEVARERVRSELALLLLGPHVASGLALLRRTGLEAALAPGVRPDAIAVVAALPPDLDLRLAGWLRGTDAAAILRRLRFSRRASRRVGHLLRQHPIGAGVNPKRDVMIRRLIKRVGEEDLEPLCRLREAELDSTAAEPGAAEQLRSIRAAIDRVRRSGALALRRFDLAISGRDVMELIGCGPGRTVGRALRYLTEVVIEQPERNTPERLRELLLRWAEDQPDL